MITRNPLTHYGKIILQTKLEWLRKEQERVIDEISEARKKGDLSENFEYHAAKRRNGELSAEIGKMEQYLSSVITPRIPPNITMACFGTEVTILNKDSKVKSTYIIVGDKEASPEKGSISISSALAQNILGKTVRADFEVNGYKYEILEIKAAADADLQKVVIDNEWGCG